MNEPTPDPLDLRSLADDASPTLDADAMFADLERDLAREVGPVARLRSLETSKRVGLGVIAALFITALSLGLTGRPDWALYPASRMIAELSAVALVFTGALWWTLFPAHRPTPRTLWTLLLVATGTSLPFVLAALPMAHALHDASLQGAGEDLAARAGACFIWGMVSALPVLFLLVALDRDGQSSGSRIVCAAVAAALVGVLSLQVHCPITQPIHLLWGHASVGVGLLVGYAGYRALRRARG